MKNYCYIVLNKKGNPVLINCQLPIFWNKRVAKDVCLDFPGSTVKKIFMDDLKDIVADPYRPTVIKNDN